MACGRVVNHNDLVYACMYQSSWYHVFWELTKAMHLWLSNWYIKIKAWKSLKLCAAADCNSTEIQWKVVRRGWTRFEARARVACISSGISECNDHPPGWLENRPPKSLMYDLAVPTIEDGAIKIISLLARDIIVCLWHFCQLWRQIHNAFVFTFKAFIVLWLECVATRCLKMYCFSLRVAIKN